MESLVSSRLIWFNLGLFQTIYILSDLILFGPEQLILFVSINSKNKLYCTSKNKEYGSCLYTGSKMSFKDYKKGKKKEQ